MTTEPPRSHAGLPKPSTRQIVLTGLLVAALVAVGAYLIERRSGATTAGRPPSSVASGPTTTPPASSVAAASTAIVFEVNLRQALGGCWVPEGPGGVAGSYRQDLYYSGPAGRCPSGGWEVEVEFLPTSSDASAARAALADPTDAFTSSELLIVVSSTAPPGILAAAEKAAAEGVQP
jgi:hypothetical protein